LGYCQGAVALDGLLTEKERSDAEILLRALGGWGDSGLYVCMVCRVFFLGRMMERIVWENVLVSIEE
jgi:hypothetical protein